MRAVVQRVTRAAVSVDGEDVGTIRAGLAVLLGVAAGDTPADAAAVAAKISGLRVFSDDDGKMNLSVVEVGGAVLLISQFTLLGDVRKGRRPSFTRAAAPDEAAALVDSVASHLTEAGIRVDTGRFGAHMEVDLCNDGPVTILIESVGGRIV